MINKLAKEIHKLALSKGWWENQNDGEKLALMHSEISEVLEALRKGNPPDDKIPEFSSAEVELADLIIRALDWTAFHGYDMEKTILAKCEFNKTRPYKHGKKF